MDAFAQNVTTAGVVLGKRGLMKRFMGMEGLIVLADFFFSALGGISAADHAVKWNHASNKAHGPGTAIRIYAGSHPSEGAKLDLRGNIPDISLWTEAGEKIGHSKHRHHGIVAQGAFVDIFVPHSNSVQTARPHYVNIMAGGPDALCISAIEFKYPDGQGVTITGDVVKRCEMLDKPASPSGKHLRNVYKNSKTQIGYDNVTPACFFLDGNHSYKHLWMSAISMRLPDFHPTNARADEWTHHPERLCGPSPRMYYHEGKVNKNLHPPVWFPPFQTHENNTDVDQHRVEQWSATEAKRKFSHYGPRDLVNWNATTPVEELVDESIPNQPRRLIKSHRGNFSAIDQCYEGRNTGDDYISMSEGVFCDMKLRNMWHVCDDSFTEGCFDTDTNVLRGFKFDDPDDEDAGVADAIETNTTTTTEEGRPSTSAKKIVEAIPLHNDKRGAPHRFFNVTGAGQVSLPTVTIDHDGAVYGMKYQKIEILK